DARRSMLRRAFATSWLAEGGNENELMLVAGWKSRTKIDRYTKATAVERARATPCPSVPRRPSLTGSGVGLTVCRVAGGLEGGADPGRVSVPRYPPQQRETQPARGGPAMDT